MIKMIILRRKRKILKIKLIILKIIFKIKIIKKIRFQTIYHKIKNKTKRMIKK
jgi:hypothetical protein